VKIVQQHIESTGMEVVEKREAAINAGEKDNPQDPAFVTSLLGQHDHFLEVRRRIMCYIHLHIHTLYTPAYTPALPCVHLCAPVIIHVFTRHI
jgi:hypothetical protein